MFYFLYIVVLYCLVPSESSEDPNSLKLALQTVLDFGSKGSNYDPQTLDYFRKFIDKIKIAVDKTTVEARRSNSHNDGETMKFSDFLQKLITIIKQLDDEELDNLLDVVNEEARNYKYEGCKFSELVDSPAVRRAIHDSLDFLQSISLSSVRKSLEKMYKKLKEHELSATERRAVSFLNALYDKRHVNKMEESLQNLSSYQKNSSSHTKRSLAEIIRQGLRSIIFDHFSQMPAIGRQFLKQNIGGLYEKATGKTINTYKISDDVDSVEDKKDLLRSKTSKTKEDKADKSVEEKAPLRFISLFPEDRKAKKVTTPKHKKAKTEKKKKQETTSSSSSSSEETSHSKSKRMTKMTTSSSPKPKRKEKKPKEVTANDRSSSSFSDERPSSKTTKKHIVTKTTSKKDTSLSGSFSSEKWAAITTKHHAKTGGKKHEEIVGISLGSVSSGEVDSPKTGSKKAKTMKKPLKKMRLDASEDENKSQSKKEKETKSSTTKHKNDLFGFLMSLSSDEGTGSDKAKKTAKHKKDVEAKTRKPIKRMRPKQTEDEDGKSHEKTQSPTSTTTNLLWEIGVSLFEAAINGGVTDKPEKPSKDKREKVSEEKPEQVSKEKPEKVSKEKPEKVSKEKPEKVSKEKPVNEDRASSENDSNLSGNNKDWLRTSKKDRHGALRNKKKSVHSKSKKKKPRKNETSSEMEDTESDGINKIKIGKRATAHSVERNGFIQFLMQAPSKKSTTTKATTTPQDERRLYWASARPIEQGMVPRVLRKDNPEDRHEVDDSSETYYESDFSAQKDYRMDQGLSIETISYNMRKQLSPQNLTIIDVKKVIKETGDDSARDPYLKERIENLEQVVKDLKDKIINVTTTTTNYNMRSQDKVLKKNKGSLDSGLVKHVEKTNNLLGKDDNDSSSAEYVRTKKVETKSTTGEKSTTVFKLTTPTVVYSKVHTTSTAVTTAPKTTQPAELVFNFQITKMLLKNQSLARMLKPVVKLAESNDDLFPNLIPNGNGAEKKAIKMVDSKQIATSKPGVNTIAHKGVKNILQY